MYELGSDKNNNTTKTIIQESEDNERNWDSSYNRVWCEVIISQKTIIEVEKYD